MRAKEKIRTQWFVKKPEGDHHYGRIYKGRVFELVPTSAPEFTIEDGRAYVEEGPLEIYPGRILQDSNSNAVLADEGESVLKHTGGSGNMGGYVESYYTATRGQMKATVTESLYRVKIDLDSVLGSDVIDRKALRAFLSFIATAIAADTLSGINLRHPSYREYYEADMPIPVDQRISLGITLGRLPVEKRAGL